MNNFSKIFKIVIIATYIFYMQNLSTNAVYDKFINTSRIDYYILETMEEASISALTLSIVSEDQIIYQRVYQTKDFIEPLTLDTPFYIGSIGKSITALAIKQLVNNGMIDLEASVSEYLPWFTLKDLDNNEIKIKNLINHTSGLSLEDGNLAFTYQTHKTIESLTKDINDQLSLKYRVGRKTEYSNLNYVVLGAIIESVTGISYEAYVKENIYTPLQMDHTYHTYEEAKENGLLPHYRVVNGIEYHVNVPHPNGQVSAGYQMSSTHDMTNFLIMFLNQGYFNSTSLFSNNALSTIPDNSTYDPYWSDIPIPTGYFGHSGATFSATSQMIINQNDRLGILILTNSRDVSSDVSISALTISSGVISILNGQVPSPQVNDFNWLIIVYNAAFLLLIIWDIMLSKKYLAAYRKPRKSIRIMWGILDGLIPILILYFIPLPFQTNWVFLLNASPEYTLSIFVGS